MTIINVGLIGTGFMGKAHVFGFATAERVFNLPCQYHLHMVADATDALASAASTSLGFTTYTSNWQDIINDP
ncbi:MAG: gfo/Idh/MocA family oxidoreductase, partial [Alphaproteobacteria bacterium]|nr:gfo/Idh/MocA family oxidoreductase [Alphaproteobacteria bacterium]